MQPKEAGSQPRALRVTVSRNRPARPGLGGSQEKPRRCLEGGRGRTGSGPGFKSPAWIQPSLRLPLCHEQAEAETSMALSSGALGRDLGPRASRRAQRRGGEVRKGGAWPVPEAKWICPRTRLLRGQVSPSPRPALRSPGLAAAGWTETVGDSSLL